MKEQPIIKSSALNINKFSFVQLFNDSKGKTNPSQTAGLIIVLCSCIGFLFSISIQFNEGIMGASAFVITGGALLGVKSVTADKEVSEGVSGDVITAEKT